MSTLHTAHDELTFKTLENSQQFEKAYAAIEQGRATPLVAVPAPVSKGAPSSTALDGLAPLQALGELHSSGVITKEEFEAKKTTLIARI